jgi:two-component system, response regulator
MNNSLLPELVLVEDNCDDEFLSRRAIANSGVACQVIVQRDGAEAVEHLLSDRAPPALIVLDYDLPKLNGREILVRLRASELTRFIPVVIFSGIAGQRLTDCYREGANSCVVKPVDVKEYMERIEWMTRYWLGVNLPHGRDDISSTRSAYASA